MCRQHWLTSVDLHMLHTDPKYQRRGAASALLKWGTERADQLGLPVYLESSHAGHILYGRHGFKDIEIFECDMRPFGGDKTFTVSLMIREPLKSSA
jgi:GNAT superfamily N-acetyltransferase